MTDLPDLPDLLARLRRGDSTAADEFVRDYGPSVRIGIRTRLTDPRLRRHFDSEDICQSVMASFLARAACGQLAPNDPVSLLRLLARMAIRKVGQRAQGLRRQRRDHRRDAAVDPAQLSQIPSFAPKPDHVVACRELLASVRAGLTHADRQIADLRADGMSWGEVADRVGGTPEARRKQLRRALDDVLVTLGVEDAP